MKHRLFTKQRGSSGFCKWDLAIDNDNAGDMYDTECGEMHYFSVEGIKQNGYIYCPYCGKKIKEV